MIEEQFDTVECGGEDIMQVDDSTDVNNPPISMEPNNDESTENVATAVTTETTEVNSDSNSLPAISEDLPNGNSQDTKISNELDAEMVSEDELPAPAQPKVDDAEDLSDEELPGPKRAELPADTEVVSEDEFPSSNKAKRKCDGGKEGADENADTPKKRAKADSDSKNHFYSFFSYNLGIIFTNFIALLFIFQIKMQKNRAKLVTKRHREKHCQTLTDIGKRLMMIQVILPHGHTFYNM